MDNVVVLVEDEPPADDPELLGLYEGTPLTERGLSGTPACCRTGSPSTGTPPCGCARPGGAWSTEVGVTVVHEIAHHFGIDDERLHELGWA